MNPHRLLLPLLLATISIAPITAAPREEKSEVKREAKPSLKKNEVPLGATRREIEMSQRALAEIEKSPRIKMLDPNSSSTAEALLGKLNEMARELGAKSARPEIAYEVKVIEDDDLNAFTLPNGKIFLFRGLLEFAGSDDEVAGVLSHEIGHNAKMHALRGEAKAKKLSWASLAAVAAMLSGRSGQDVGQFSRYLLVGILNGYSENYEKEADAAAIEQMKGTRWNPSALVTFMGRLEQAEKSRPEFEPGIFRTHPTSSARSQAAIAQMKAEGIAFAPRDVLGARRAQAIASADRVRILFGSDVLIELAATPRNLPSVQARAEVVVQKVNALLKDNLKMHEIVAAGDARGAALRARGQEVARISVEDAGLSKLSPLEAAARARDAFRRLFWREAIQGSL